jgi:hypothetical protein
MKTIKQLQREETQFLLNLQAQLTTKILSNGEAAEINISIAKSVYFIETLQKEIEKTTIK